MRDLFLVGAIFLGLVATLRYPFAGILLWAWFTCMDPHHETYGFSQTAPLNYIIAVVTILAWGVSKERKIPPLDATFFLTLAFLGWITINGFFAVKPDWSWPLWDRTWKTIALGLFVAVMATNKVRIHALVWVVVISLFYYGIKGGIFTILTGGHSHVVGAPNTYMGDNNMLAVETLMILPLANYLRLHSANRYVSRGLLAGIALSTISVLGSYSRGGFIALGGLGVAAWFRSRRKLLYLVGSILVVVSALYFMPQQYFDRLDSIGSADTDNSFQGRLVAWQVAFDYARDHFPLGDGFSGSEQPQVFNYYFPDEKTHAAHSIFFQVLGDNGFLGFGLYMGILLVAFWNCRKIRVATRRNEEYRWAYDLAGMIQLSLFVFCLGGAALSLAYYDVLFICAGLLSALRVLLKDVISAKTRYIIRPMFEEPAIAQATSKY